MGVSERLLQMKADAAKRFQAKHGNLDGFDAGWKATESEYLVMASEAEAKYVEEKRLYDDYQKQPARMHYPTMGDPKPPRNPDEPA